MAVTKNVRLFACYYFLRQFGIAHLSLEGDKMHKNVSTKELQYQYLGTRMIFFLVFDQYASSEKTLATP